ncbi:MAG: glycerate kinase [Clostridiales bacterium]|jgi:glycerate kinase|nr:glycerate kinase [Clostridiales bacterium]
MFGELKRFVLIPDSFKGTMGSAEICEILEGAIRESFPEAQIRQIPVADGGEGSVDAFLRALPGKKAEARVKGPFFEDIASFYGLLGDGGTAVVEMAACAGLPLAEGRLDPMAATTFGVGQLILEAARAGAKKIIVGLGGSATNDGGCGAAAAAGVKFFDRDGKEFVPTGGTLADIAAIDASGYDPLLRGAEIVAMCDIDNPLHGPDGAAHVFGPQKGASPEMARLLDDGLRSFDAALRASLGKDLSRMPGAGAAGGMGAGMAAFFGAELKMGIDVVLDTVHFDELARDADLILTGEGRIDAQSLRGKVAIGVARRARAAGVPTVAIVGDAGDGAEGAYAEGVSGIFSINRLAVDFSLARPRCRDDLRFAAANLMRFCKAMQPNEP